MSASVKRLAVIGVGLIGGSFALALKEAGAVESVVGCGRTKENLYDALAIGAIDDATTEAAEAVEGADVIMLAVPVRSMVPIIAEVSHLIKPGAIVTDAGSTKEVVTGELVGHLPNYVHVVPGHPIAGSEKTGAIAATAGLYKGRRTILTPGKFTDPAAVELVKKLWEAAGARVETMAPDVHDVVLGAVSHLPHMVAYALVDTLLKWDDQVPMLRFSAGGLKDFTRVASSSPEMWRDVCLDNRVAIIEAIDRLTATLGEVKREIEAGNEKALLERFTRCREVRKRITSGDQG